MPGMRQVGAPCGVARRYAGRRRNDALRAGPHAWVHAVLTVRIRKNDTSEEVTREVWHDDADSAHFYYSEGNGSCDCNRLLEWRRGMGLLGEGEWPDDDTGYCLGKGQYAVTLLEGAEAIYQDDGNPR